MWRVRLRMKLAEKEAGLKEKKEEERLSLYDV